MIQVSNLNMHGVDSFATADAFLGTKSSAPLCYATTLFRSGGWIIVTHHHTEIVRYRGDGTIEIRNGGFMSRTTTHRLHGMTPASVRVSGAKGGSVTSDHYNGCQPYSWERVA